MSQSPSANNLGGYRSIDDYFRRRQSDYPILESDIPETQAPGEQQTPSTFRAPIGGRPQSQSPDDSVVPRQAANPRKRPAPASRDASLPYPATKSRSVAGTSKEPLVIDDDFDGRDDDELDRPDEYGHTKAMRIAIDKDVARANRKQARSDRSAFPAKRQKTPSNQSPAEMVKIIMEYSNTVQGWIPEEYTPFYQGKRAFNQPQDWPKSLLASLINLSRDYKDVTLGRATIGGIVRERWSNVPSAKRCAIAADIEKARKELTSQQPKRDDRSPTFGRTLSFSAPDSAAALDNQPSLNVAQPTRGDTPGETGQPPVSPARSVQKPQSGSRWEFSPVMERDEDAQGSRNPGLSVKARAGPNDGLRPVNQRSELESLDGRVSLSHSESDSLLRALREERGRLAKEREEFQDQLEELQKKCEDICKEIENRDEQLANIKDEISRVRDGQS